MKRLFVSAALLPLVYAAGAEAETKISTAITTPVKTSTAANGSPDSITIETAGSIKPTAAGAAVTIDSNHAVKNLGIISFEGVNGATGVLLNGGVSASLTNTGSISVAENYTATDSDNDGDLDGPFAQGSNRYGIRAVGAAPFTGDVRNEGQVSVEGNDSAGISLETRLVGSLTHTGAVGVVGDRTVGIRADSVSGDVRILGAVQAQGEGAVGVLLGQVDGGVVLQHAVTATGYRHGERLSDAARAKLDADDLKQGGGALRITGNVVKGVLLEAPPADKSAEDKDEDDDGVEDAKEGKGVLTSLGSAPSLDIGSAQATTIGVVGNGDFLYGLVLKGDVLANGLNNGVSATAIRIGQVGGGTTTINGGVNNLGGTVVAQAYDGQATAVLLNASAAAPRLRNTGSISAAEFGGQHDARAVVDLSGGLTLVENLGEIKAVVSVDSGEAATGRAVALDLSANTSGVVVRQSKLTADAKPAIVGEVRFGAGADRLEVLGGTLTGAMSFGGGADALVLDGGAQVAGRLTDDGTLAVDLRDGRLAFANTDPMAIGSLSVGAKGVLAVIIDPAADDLTRLNVAGAATFANGAKVDVALKSIVDGPESFQILQAGSLQFGQTGTTLAGAPFLYQASLRADQAAGALFVDLRPKTAAEIGLNRSGAQAYDAVFDALDEDDAIEQAFLAQTTQEGLVGLYEQMLPDHSGGALMSAAAISAAVSSATGQPMVIDEESGTGVWAQEILFQIERDRDDAAGFKSQGFGLAAGVDLMGEANALGLSASFVSTDYHDRGAAAGEQVSMNVLGGGLYWRLSAGALQANARGGLGYAWFEGERRLVGAGLDRRTEADWTGWIAEAHAGASYELSAGVFYVRPELSVDYLRLSEDGYSEDGGGDGFDLTVEDRKGDLLTGQAVLALGARFGDEVYWSPELKVGYRAKLAGEPGRTTARFGDGDPFTLDPEEVFDGGLIARVGLRGGTDKVLYAIEGGGTFEDAYSEYDVRATVRFQF